MTDEVITIVDDTDTHVDDMPRSKVVRGKDIYRVSGLWLMDSDGRVLLAQRSFNKPGGAGQWSIAVEGTVASGDNSEQTIRREALEEIGINLGDVVAIDKVFVSTTETKFFNQLFFIQMPFEVADIVIQKEEVAAVRLADLSELEADVESNPSKYVQQIPEYLASLRKHLAG